MVQSCIGKVIVLTNDQYVDISRTLLGAHKKLSPKTAALKVCIWVNSWTIKVQ